MSAPTPTPISAADVAKVAGLARLLLDEHELEEFTAQLQSILEHAREIEALDLDDVPPTSHPLPLANVTRPDVVVAGVDRDEVLSQAPSAESGMFRVPPVLGEGA